MALDYTQTFLLTVPLVNISEIYLSIRVRYKQELLGLAWLGYSVFSDQWSLFKQPALPPHGIYSRFNILEHTRVPQIKVIPCIITVSWYNIFSARAHYANHHENLSDLKKFFQQVEELGRVKQ